MKDIGYKLLKGLLTLVACMPLGVLYVFSDFIFLLIYYVVRYRQKCGIVFLALRQLGMGTVDDTSCRSAAR